ncbi:MAG: GH3 auxin-responsive promoter family protein [Deltaproteobacteria bacterium]|nr:GH3 auxin-responsive promoter family protein [Deltaproteobacteria bacterium]
MIKGRRIASGIMAFGIRRKGLPMLKQLDVASANVKQAQQNTLRGIIEYATNTAYGKSHGFGSIKSTRDFTSAVPVNDWEAHRPWVERHEKGEPNVLFPGKPMFYATTSGTTSAPKRIPISRKYHDECYNGLSNIWLHSMFQQSPGFMDGYDISMVGKAIEGYTDDGTSFGSFSGHMNAYMPDFIKRFRVIPFEIHDIDDYPSKYYALLRVALAHPIRWIVAANPSTLLELHRSAMTSIEEIVRDIHDGTLKSSLLISPQIRQRIEIRLKPSPKRARQLEALLAMHGDNLRPKHYWPTLQMINTWKSGNAALYLAQTKNFYPPHTVIREFGYLATEARAGIVLDNNQETSILAAHLLYFEFIERSDLYNSQPTVLGAHELEKGGEYAILITTPSGLYRYNINDILRVEDFYGTFPMVRFVQKGSGVTSLTGEKLYESQYLDAFAEAAASLRLQTVFHAAFADLEESMYHCFVELAAAENINAVPTDELASRLDKTLQTKNPEYAAKRKSNRLRPLKIHLLRTNAFTEYKLHQLSQGQREGQFKLTHLQQNNDQLKLFQSLSIDHFYSSGGAL